MRLPDPYTHPGLVPGFESVTLIDNDPVTKDRMANNQVFEVRTVSQYWGISIPFPDLFPKEFFLMDAFIGEYKRKGGFIEILLPQYETFGIRGDLANAKIPGGQKGNSLTMNIPNLTGLPKVGGLFKLSSHYKVYKITSVTTNGNNLTLGLYPDLATTTNGAEKPVFNGILFQTKPLQLETWKSTLTSDGMYESFTLNFEESR
ncbi:hypothetical protein [Providencia phage PSTCR5]|uniref:Distal tail protein n=1 Tax=Providencia phage PSTCR5 TaxID=2783547 RepID=A0A873WX21_9CAUD|nr:distal tail protein [Providencia phage PSTCR5]QPB12127.1 hypothetical protein [Providencia phage PSTCR5]